MEDSYECSQVECTLGLRNEKSISGAENLTLISALHFKCKQYVVHDLSKTSPKVLLRVNQVELFQGFMCALSTTRMVEEGFFFHSEYLLTYHKMCPI